MNASEWLEKVRSGILAAFESPRKASATFIISSLIFIAMALSSSPGYTLQMFSSGIEYWLPAVKMRILGTYLSGGIQNTALLAFYSLLTGIAVKNFATQLRNSGAKIRNLSGILPGFITAGCAGCGVGLMGFLGLTGGLASLPFQGGLIRFGGIGLLFYYIGRTGDPKVCAIPDE